MINTNHSLGIDIGGTSTRCAIINSENKIISVSKVATKQTDINSTVITCIDKLVENGPQEFTFSTAGISLPEFVVRGEATSSIVVNWSPSTKQLIQFHLAEKYGIKVPIHVDSDVRCGAMAEAFARPVENASKSVLYISWGTGVSSTLILPNLQCLEGDRGQAITVGEWLTADFSRTKKLEAYASGQGISDEYRHATSQILTTEEIVRRASSGDTTAEEITQVAARAIGYAIADLVYVLDPGLVVLGGGIGSSETLLSQIAIDTYKLRDDHRNWPKIEAPIFHENSSLIGSAIQARIKESE